MTSESMIPGRRNTVLATVVGAVLASYAGGAAALEFESDSGVRVNWNTTVSAGSSWRSEDPNKLLYSLADASLIGKYKGNYIPGTVLNSAEGHAGNWAGGEATLNYAKGDRFSTPFKILSDVEVKKGNYGGLVRIKAWYDQATSEENVRLGNQANAFNGARPTGSPYIGPTLPNCFPTVAPANIGKCIPMSTPGVNNWPRAKLSDTGFEDEQKFSNLMLLDAYVYGSWELGDTDLQVRLGNQVVNWGESLFIQGINQINPIDVPAARRSGAEIKEILLPVWMAYANWGVPFGSFEAFYQLQWNNTSIDSCGTYWAVTAGAISSKPGPCNSATAFGNVLGTAAPGTVSPLIPQFGSSPYLQATGQYVPLGKGKDAKDGGQFGVAFRFPVEKLDTEFGLYGMNIHARIPMISSRAGTYIGDLTAQQQAILKSVGLVDVDTLGWYWKSGATKIRAPIPIFTQTAAAIGAQAGVPIAMKSSTSFWEYPENIQIFGLTTASNIAGWSVSSELSYTPNMPVQINGNDLLIGGFAFYGPHWEDSVKVYQKGTGAYLKGYDRFDKTQFQVNTVKTYSHVLGSDNMLIVGEVGAQWNNVPDYTTGAVRYGRGFMWGYGSSPAWAQTLPPTAGNLCTPTFAGLPVPVASGTVYNPNPRGCRYDGYVTD
ncbi:MAG: DUF1302 domain-containing protein, partial [Gammaproteobacteria bacterium]|nr:DUF1302 domain-containing protein [Gammaproteobacteria bacterium]